MQRHKFYVLFLLSFFYLQANSATKEEVFNLDLQRHAYKIELSDIEIEYYIEPITNLPKAKVTEKIIFEKTKNNANFHHRTVFDDTNREFEDYSYKAVKGIRTKPGKSSGLLSRGGIFHSDLKFQSFTIYLNKIGDKGQLTIKKKINDLRYLNIMDFHHIYPTISSQIRVIVPDNFDINLIHHRFENWNAEHNIIEGDLKKTYVYKVNNLECANYYSEDYKVLAFDYYPSVFLVPKSVNISGNNKDIFSKTSDLYFWLKTFLDELKPDKTVLDSLYSEIVPTASSKNQKLKLIYDWVQDNIRYIAFEEGINGFKPDEAHLVYKKRYGDCKGKANLCIELLKRAGFDARFVWVSTSYYPYTYEETPLLIKDNHMICAVYEDGEFKYLDPTSTFLSSDEVPHYLAGKEVLIENGDGFVIDTIHHMSASQKNGLIRTVEFDSISKSSMFGSFKMELNGDIKRFLFGILEGVNKLDVDKTLKSFVEADSKLNLKNFTTSELFDKDSPFIIEGEIEFKNSVQQFGSSRKFLAQYPYEDLITLKWVKNTKVPFEFMWPINIQDSIIYKIGEEFKLQNEKSSEPIANHGLSFNEKIEQGDDSKVIVNRNIRIHSNMIKNDEIDGFNKATERIIKDSEEYLIIKK